MHVCQREVVDASNVAVSQQIAEAGTNQLGFIVQVSEAFERRCAMGLHFGSARCQDKSSCVVGIRFA